MKNTIKTIFLCIGIAALTGCSGTKKTFVTIGTGSVTGVYYPAGGAIKKMVDQYAAGEGLQLSVEATGGSVYNVNAVLSGDLDFGIAQSDRQFQAWNGTADWEGKPQSRLRSVFSLHPEIVTLIASVDSGIQSISDLKGKTVNIGNPGSGHRGNATDILRTAGLDTENDFKAEGLKAAECAKMLQDGRIDAYFYTVGHPNGSISEATTGKRKVNLIPITGMEKLIEQAPYYAAATIPGSLYKMAASEGDIASIGVVTTVITSADVSDEVVYALVKSVMDHLEEFKTFHPALEQLSKESMLNGLTADLHPGAKRYFVEAGLLEE